LVHPSSPSTRRLASRPKPAILSRIAPDRYAIAGFIRFCAVVGPLATMGLKEYTNEDISAEYDADLR